MFLAPTGKAASAIGGVTQHSAFALDIRQQGATNEEMVHRQEEYSARRMRRLQTTFKNVRWLFFDEVSMTSSEVMSEIDSALRVGTQKLDQPFGGINVIFAGDLCQLPPVKSAPLYVPHSVAGRSADTRTKVELGRAAWLQLNAVVDFCQQMRMQDDAMAATLSRLRLRQCTDEDAQLLNLNVLKSTLFPMGTSLRDHPNAIALARTNNTVRMLNLRKAAVQAESTSNALAISYAKDTSPSPISELQRRMLLSYNGDSGNSRTRGAIGRVPLYIGMPVVYRGPNVSVPLGVTNGAFATVAGWDLELDRFGLTVPRGVVLKFSTEAKWALTGLEAGCLPITPGRSSFKFTKDDSVSSSVDGQQRRSDAQQVTRHQLPLQPGFAMTVHSAQGVTSQSGIIVDLTTGGFEAYVAASRATTRDAVYLVSATTKEQLNRPPLPESLVTELERLREIAAKTRLLHEHDKWRLTQALKRTADGDLSTRPLQRARTAH
ncbi:hypothetical protein A4X13_0g8990 [Tilletia indica]|uniref:ATP-dependent DNA helicase n=1 Tax=Tilletia indica TaxID=43049 RepID=A0A8T8SC18_9BASI|nr:hypothetical protein A4X13_0g8990 [Tilletia indica]